MGALIPTLAFLLGMVVGGLLALAGFRVGMKCGDAQPSGVRAKKDELLRAEVRREVRALLHPHAKELLWAAEHGYFSQGRG